MNQSLFLWFNHLALAWPATLWSCLTVLGHSSMVFALLSPALIGRPALITSILVCAPMAGAGVYVLKNLFLHARPPAVLPHDQFVQIGDAVLLHSSFPSGHTTTAFAVVTMCAVFLFRSEWSQAAAQHPTRRRLPLLAALALGLLALLVGASRMAVGAHWPQDVLAGAVLGTLCGYASARAAVALHRKAWTDSALYRLVQIALVLTLSISLFVIDMDYPLAEPFQWVTGVFGCAWSLLAAVLLIRKTKLGRVGES
jgi:membrane-associated phospholipid phosphatase